MAEDGENRAEEATEVKQERKVLSVFAVKTGFFLNGELVSPVDLRPAGEARHYIIGSNFLTFGNQVILVPERRPRADNGDVVRDGNVPDLRQLIQAGTSQELAYTGDPLFRIGKHVSGNIMRRIGAHGAEFEDVEVREHAVLLFAHTALFEKHRAGIINQNSQGDEKVEGRQNQKAC